MPPERERPSQANIAKKIALHVMSQKFALLYSLFYKYVLQGDVELWNKYKQLRKEMNHLTNRAYNDYFQTLAINSDKHPKRFWSFVNAKRKTKNVTSLNV